MIDIHQHADWLGKNKRDLIAYLDKGGIRKCWLLSWESVTGGLEPYYQHLSIENVYATYKMFPRRIVPFCGVDPRRENAGQLLRDLRKKGFRGYGELKFNIVADNPDLIRMLRLAGKLNMPALLHLDVDIPSTPQWYLGDIGHLENAARLCPDTVLIGHGPGFWRELSAGETYAPDVIYPTGRIKPGGQLLRILEKYPNVYADLSADSGLTALTRDPKFAKSMLTRFSNKIMYGTDNYHWRHIDFLKSLRLSPEVFKRITQGNALRLIH